ncbi:hypothetical protein [Burkholderia contaminans]|uniref:Uncharacterized protein n=1 Tax=Burkholderia contaminans TaxID=488447 RepID=A0A3N8QE67_9BURK|nr:hypothetical protein [Burkholderia contaminans]RQT22088.1 hypothetical protein DF037_28680 [Burkholderia contaminans]
MNHMERLDITADPIASEVVGNLNTANGIVVLQIFKTAAERLDYLFARQPIVAPLPDTVMDVLGEALDDIEAGVTGRHLAVDVLAALAVEGILMHMGPSTVGLLQVEQLRRGTKATQGDSFAASLLVEPGTPELEVIQAELTGGKRESTRIEVDVANDQIVVATKGSVATYNWRAGAYDNRVARLSIQPIHQVVGASKEETYRVVAGDVSEIHRPSSILAENLNQAEALEVIKRIHSGVKAALGIAFLPDAAGTSQGTSTEERAKAQPISSAEESALRGDSSAGATAVPPQAIVGSQAARFIAWAESLFGEILFGAAMIVLIIGLPFFAFLFVRFVVTDLAPWVVTELTAWGVL